MRSSALPLAGLAGEPAWSRASPDGKYVAYVVIASDGLASLQVLDVDAITVSPPIPTHEEVGYYADLAWRADSGAVAVAVDTEWVRVWARDGGRLLSEHRVPDDGVDTVTCLVGDDVVIWTRKGWVESLTVLVALWYGCGSATTRWSRPLRGDGVAAAGFRESVALADPRTGEVVRPAVSVALYPDGLDWSPDGTTIAAVVPPAVGGVGVTAMLDGVTLSVAAWPTPTGVP